MSVDGSAGYSDLASAKHMAVPGVIQNQSASLSGSSYSTAMLPGDGGVSLERLGFSGLELTCPIDVNEITTRWMKPYIPGPGEAIRKLSRQRRFVHLLNVELIHSCGRDLVPFNHPIKQQPASSTCLSLVRICQNPLPGRTRQR